MTPEEQIKELKRQVKELKADIALLEANQIKIVSGFDGTNVQVSINGIRRKITTSSP